MLALMNRVNELDQEKMVIPLWKRINVRKMIHQIFETNNLNLFKTVNNLPDDDPEEIIKTYLHIKDEYEEEQLWPELEKKYKNITQPDINMIDEFIENLKK